MCYFLNGFTCTVTVQYSVPYFLRLRIDVLHVYCTIHVIFSDDTDFQMHCCVNGNMHIRIILNLIFLMCCLLPVERGRMKDLREEVGTKACIVGPRQNS